MTSPSNSTPGRFATRRRFLAGAAGAAAALGTTALPALGAPTRMTRQQMIEQQQAYLRMYGPLPNERFPIPGVDISLMDPAYLRRIGDYQTDERPGTVIVDTEQRVAFLVLPEGKAIRYGVGIGRDGFAWAGRGIIQFKREWPTWTPPANMIERQPELEEFRNGMAPGLDNPLGARALYIFQNGRDTLYRLHGTSDPETIGKAVSSGCVRFLNQDVIDLFNRVATPAPILVMGDASAVHVHS